MTREAARQRRPSERMRHRSAPRSRSEGVRNSCQSTCRNGIANPTSPPARAESPAKKVVAGSGGVCLQGLRSSGRRGRRRLGAPRPSERVFAPSPPTCLRPLFSSVTGYSTGGFFLPKHFYCARPVSPHCMVGLSSSSLGTLVLVFLMASASTSSRDLVMPAEYVREGTNAAKSEACSQREFCTIAREAPTAREALASTGDLFREPCGHVSR